MTSVLIWGTGVLANKILPLIEKDDDKKCVGFIHSFPNSDKFGEYKIYKPDEVNTLNINYDAIIIASSYVHEIRKQILEYGIDLAKVTWLYGRAFTIEDIYNYEILNVARKEYIEKYTEGEIKVVPITWLEHEICSEYADNYIRDYVRFSTFDMVTRLIPNELEGNVAEFGVFRGDFARAISERFQNRKLYLFDTFDGFSDVEAQNEMDKGHCNEEFIERFKNTSLEYVKSRMPHPENCIYVQGLFPESLNGLEDNFVFVSIDVDFEESIYEGLKYFYPRLVEGGYIFVHDYNHKELKGVKKAVERFESEFGRVVKVPIADECGSLIISK